MDVLENHVSETEKLTDEEMHKKIESLPISDKEDLIDLINFWREGWTSINYWSVDEEKKWKPIHDRIQQDKSYYLYTFSKQILEEKAKFTNNYHKKKMIKYIDELLQAKNNSAIDTLVNQAREVTDKKQKEKYFLLLQNFRHDKKALQEIKDSYEKAIDQWKFTQEKTIQKAKQRSQAKDLIKNL